MVNVFEDVVATEVASELLQAATKTASIYQKSIPLPPGTYRLNLVVKDIVGGNMTNFEMALNVPRYEEEKLGMSSIVLADMIEKVPTKQIGTGQFVIGSSKVRPRVGESFRRDEKMGIYVQFYNFTADEKTAKPNATVEYEVVKTGSTEKMFSFSEEVAKVDGSSAQQYTVEKLLPLQNFEPGDYTLRMKVTDKFNNATLSPTATFKVI